MSEQVRLPVGSSGTGRSRKIKKNGKILLYIIGKSAFYRKRINVTKVCSETVRKQDFR